MSNYRYAGIETFDINNGTGFGVTLFVQGCPHHCAGCHNPSTWDFGGGLPLDYKTINALMDVCGDENIRRLTISGGEPFANFEMTYSIASMFKNKYPGKRLWIYTGFSFESLLLNNRFAPLLSITDVVVDGAFVKELKDLSLPYRGSSNQRIIDVPASIKCNQVILLNMPGD